MDLRVYRAQGVVGMTVIAAVTAQNSRSVIGVHKLPALFVRRQLKAIWEEVEPKAVCIGLLPDRATIRTVRLFLHGLARPPAIVVDPVVASSSGYTFLDERDLRELRRLLPLATVVTPNLLEAAKLTARPVATLAQAESAAGSLSKFGCAVLVTGGHLASKTCIDIFADYDGVRRYRGSRINRVLRGSGGILAAAIAACLAKGMSLERSVAQARAFVRRAFYRAVQLGSGFPQNL